MTRRYVVLSIWHQGTHLVRANVAWPENLDIPSLVDTDVLVMSDGETEMEFVLSQRMMFAKKDESFTLLSLRPSAGSNVGAEKVRGLVKGSFWPVEFHLV